MELGRILASVLDVLLILSNRKDLCRYPTDFVIRTLNPLAKSTNMAMQCRVVVRRIQPRVGSVTQSSFYWVVDQCAIHVGH